MTYDDIDDILGDEDEITPSPEFLASVMRAVRREATSLPPLKFPWKRALPGILATAAAIARLLWDLIGILSDPPTLAVLREQLAQFATAAAGFGLQWIVLAITITILSLVLSLSLAGVKHYARTDGRVRSMVRALMRVLR